MAPSAMIFFALFAAVIFTMYVALRRRWGPTAVVAGAGVMGSVIAMMLFALAQGNILLHSLVVGLLVGGAFSVAALVMAWYFQGNELRREFEGQHQADEAAG